MASEKFQQLTDAEWMRIRPATIIGSVTEEEHTIFDGEKWKALKIVPGLVKIISEIIDNSVDAHIRTGKKMNLHVDIINDVIDGLLHVKVGDDGGGIPVVKHGDHWQPELSWLRARAGTSFGDERQTIGANGIGSFATAVFSEKFYGISCDGKNICSVIAKHGIADSVHVKKATKTSIPGCHVNFTPDLSCFNEGEIDIVDHVEYFRIRARNLAMSFPGIKIHFNGKVMLPFDLKGFMHQVVVPECHLAFTSSEEEFRQHSYINGLYTRHGGSYVDYIMGQITPILREKILKKHKVDILPNAIKQKTFLAVWLVNKKNLCFDSQSKERITNSVNECAKFFSEIDFSAIAEKLFKNERYIMPIIQAALFKKEQAERLELARAEKAKKKIKIDNHIECNGVVMAKRQLFICEGDSAISPILEVRDPNLHGGYALRGKVMNTNGMKWVDIMKNKELSELMSIIGLKADGSISPNYGQICILTDADTDGTSIACLLVNFFSRWPALFEKKIVKRVRSPLWVGRKGKAVKYCYTQEEYEKAAKVGYTWKYIKGLGSLELEDYDEMINKPVLDTIELDDISFLEVAFGDSADRRKEWLAK